MIARVDGRFEGKYLQADQLYIGPTGKSKTNINAVSVIVEGSIIGNINASTGCSHAHGENLRRHQNTRTHHPDGVILEGRCNISNDLKSSAKDLIETEYEKNKIIPEEFLGKDDIRLGITLGDPAGIGPRL